MVFAERHLELWILEIIFALCSFAFLVDDVPKCISSLVISISAVGLFELELVEHLEYEQVIGCAVVFAEFLPSCIRCDIGTVIIRVNDLVLDGCQVQDEPAVPLITLSVGNGGRGDSGDSVRCYAGNRACCEKQRESVHYVIYI